jgi:hypothetical protein
MALITLYSTDNGIHRLLRQPEDLPSAPRAGRVEERNDAGPEHRELFGRYRADMRTVFPVAEDWWEGTVEAQERLGKSRDDAIETAFDERLAGAASHPRVVWIVRSYWLECARLNKEVPAEKGVPPHILLLKWLIDEQENELVRLVACMPYWPIGLDENGNWC